jgi:hypothetical protein
MASTISSGVEKVTVRSGVMGHYLANELTVFARERDRDIKRVRI